MQAVPEIEQIGRDVARKVAGMDVIDEVEVQTGLSSTDEPTYNFYFRIDPSRSPDRLGRVLLSLLRGLNDELSARGDEHTPMVFLLSPDDWRLRASA